MKNLEKTVKDVERLIERVVDDAKAPIKQVFAFVKRHKKLIFTVAVLYVAFKYFFEDDTEDEEEDY